MGAKSGDATAGNERRFFHAVSAAASINVRARDCDGCAQRAFLLSGGDDSAPSRV